MTYPPPLYTGDSGESTATYRRTDHPPEIQRASGTTVHYLATGASTAGHKMLLHFSPGAPREEYFERVPDLRDASEEERAAFFLKHDTFWV